MASFAGSEYGKMVRDQFKDIKGGSELAMLAAPSEEELEQLKKAVAIMTPGEKEKAGNLTDEQIQRIVNGDILHCKRVS